RHPRRPPRRRRDPHHAWCVAPPVTRPRVLRSGQTGPRSAGDRNRPGSVHVRSVSLALMESGRGATLSVAKLSSWPVVEPSLKQVLDVGVRHLWIPPAKILALQVQRGLEQIERDPHLLERGRFFTSVHDPLLTRLVRRRNLAAAAWRERYATR